MHLSRARSSSVVLRNFTKAALAPGCLFLSGCNKTYIFFLKTSRSLTPIPARPERLPTMRYDIVA